MRQLSDRAIVTNSLGSVFSIVLAAAGIAFIFLTGGEDGSGVSASNMPWDLIIFGLIIALFIAVVYSALWVRLFGYELEDKEVKVERGVISKSYDSIPYSRIQNVGIQRGLLQRILGISTVNIHTAGHSGAGMSAEGNLPGVDKVVAEEVREEIMEKARNADDAGGM